jgi:hypothetical protein
MRPVPSLDRRPPTRDLLGLVGGPLVCASGLAVLFGVIEAGSVGQFVASAPEILWEASLGLYLAVKGFRPAPVIATDAAVDLTDGPRPVRARAAAGADRMRRWARFGDFPGWGADLAGLAARRPRETAVVVLEPRGAAGGTEPS